MPANRTKGRTSTVIVSITSMCVPDLPQRPAQARTPGTCVVRVRDAACCPAYVLAVRELFPASEASWRVPTLLLFSGSGMAFGGWLAGAIYDYAGFYAITFAIGIFFNLVHLALIGVLVWRQRLRTILRPAYAAR